MIQISDSKTLDNYDLRLLDNNCNIVSEGFVILYVFEKGSLVKYWHKDSLENKISISIFLKISKILKRFTPVHSRTKLLTREYLYDLLFWQKSHVPRRRKSRF